ncbi:MAG: dTMP kinase [Eubacteriales bacterium]
MKGKFITFEGPDGAGKTTQMKMLGERLETLGKKVVYSREPGGTRISEEIRKVLLNPSNIEMVDRTEALLYAAARAQHVEELIRPALEDSKFVLCDRFTDSTVAYQGFGRGIDMDLLNKLNSMATAGIVPDLTIILDIDPALGIRRISEKRVTDSGMEKDRIELEHINFHKKVRDGFLHLAVANPGRCKLVDAKQEMEALANEIYLLVKEVLDK